MLDANEKQAPTTSNEAGDVQLTVFLSSRDDSIPRRHAGRRGEDAQSRWLRTGHIDRESRESKRNVLESVPTEESLTLHSQDDIMSMLWLRGHRTFRLTCRAEKNAGSLIERGTMQGKYTHVPIYIY